MAVQERSVLVTGAAGFIGYHLCRRLLEAGCRVTGFDNLNEYYDVRLKLARLSELAPYAQGASPRFSFWRGNLADPAAVERVFSETKPEIVVNLAAQAGVRYSIDHPDAYIATNVVGFFRVLEACRRHPVRHLVYASSSSVYGNRSADAPFATSDRTDSPVSLYAATKKTDELMAYTYSHLYGIPATGLRFFTVYGPWGRPDMAYFSFTKKMLAGERIPVFGGGELYRDYTYIDDVVEGIVRLLDDPPECRDGAMHRVYNIGNHHPEKLMDFIGTLESVLGVQAEIDFLPMQPGDVPRTSADVGELMHDYGFAPDTPLREGLTRFAEWYRAYHGTDAGKAES